MADLLELAERCEAATGPDRELDCLIFETDNLRVTGVKLNLIPQMRGTYYGEPTGRYFDISGDEPVELPYNAPAFTASLDAAFTILPGDASWSMGQTQNFRATAEVWLTGKLPVWRGRAATPALALAAAALRARQALSAEGGE